MFFCFSLWDLEIYEVSETCHKNLKRSKDMLAEMDVHEKNMTRTLQEIEDLEAILDQVKLKH